MTEGEKKSVDSLINEGDQERGSRLWLAEVKGEMLTNNSMCGPNPGGPLEGGSERGTREE